MTKTYIWWRLLCGVSVLNVLLWGWVFSLQTAMDSKSQIQTALSAIYVLVCAFRSFYPRIDLERNCLHDSPLSSIVLGRACATVAEICFSIQCALIIYNLGIFIEASWVVLISYTFVPIIILAQLFCWYATLTLNHYWHALEESAWVLMITLALFCLINGYLSLDGQKKLVMLAGISACLGSLYIMVFVDIPMYLARVKLHHTAGKQYLTLSAGIQDAWGRRVQTSDWAIWKKEVLWLTSYFTTYP